MMLIDIRNAVFLHAIFVKSDLHRAYRSALVFEAVKTFKIQDPSRPINGHRDASRHTAAEFGAVPLLRPSGRSGTGRASFTDHTRCDVSLS